MLPDRQYNVSSEHRLVIGKKGKLLFHILMICTFYFAIELFQFIANFCHFLDLVIKGLYRLHRTKGTVALSVTPPKTTQWISVKHLGILLYILMMCTSYSVFAVFRFCPNFDHFLNICHLRLYNRYTRLYNGEKGTVALYTWWLMCKSDYLFYVLHGSDFFSCISNIVL